MGAVLFACLVSAVAAADCKAENAKVAKLEAEVASLKKQLAAAAGQGQCSSASVFDAVSMTSTMAGDVITHLLAKTDIDDKVVSAVSGQAENAKALGSKVVDQIKAHPCGTGLNYDACSKHITGSDIYKAHVAPHVKSLTPLAQPYVDQASVHVNPLLDSATKAYGTAAKHVEVTVVPTVRQTTDLAYGHATTAASAIPKHLNTVLEPLFAAFSAATPKHAKSLPKDPIDRLLLICFVAFLAYNLFFIVRILVKIATKCFVLVLSIFVKLPLKLTKMWISWGFFFGTGFYVCGLCRSKKSSKTDAKAGASKPATAKELETMLQKAQDKGKLNDGVTRLVTAAKSGKPLNAPEEMKGKVVSKDMLKGALKKFKDVDIKKLGL
jgi:hypothetical protein